MALNLRERWILVVDDLREMRMTLRGLLDSLYAKQVVEARDAVEALEALRRHPFDIVLCDYNLGEGRHGQQVLEEARALGLLKPHAAWVMITAESTMGMVMGVLENHPDGYLVKPINKSVLQLRLERVMARKAIIRDIEQALAASEFGAAIALCDAQAVRAPALRSDLLRLKAEALLRSGDLDEAGELCTGVLNERELPWARVALGRARYQAGDLRQARQHFARVVEQTPTVMEAYDWLARVDAEQGDARAAQRVLAQALGLSPNSIRRQQRVGDLARRNGDFATAEKAYRRALAMGEDSCFARPDDQIGLVDAVAGAKGPGAALKLLGEMNRRTRKRDQHWRLALSEARLCHGAGRADDAAAALGRALEGCRSETGEVPAAAQLELARACFETGKTEDGQGIIDRVVRENHDREDVLDAAREMFEALGLADEGTRLIEHARQAVVEINNRGVHLAQRGEYAAAVELLTQAADELPGNLTVNLNVLQAMLLQMRKEGATNQRRFAANEYLARAERLAPASERVLRLRRQLQAQSAGQPAEACAG